VIFSSSWLFIPNYFIYVSWQPCLCVSFRIKIKIRTKSFQTRKLSDSSELHLKSYLFLLPTDRSMNLEVDLFKLEFWILFLFTFFLEFWILFLFTFFEFWVLKIKRLNSRRSKAKRSKEKKSYIVKNVKI